MENRHVVAAAIGVLLMSLPAPAAPLRVACVGDSITFGDQIADRARDSYPAVLARLADGRLVTGNFGVNGATALQVMFRDWSGTRASRDALAFAPDIVVIMLGINDLSFPHLYDRYPADLRDIVARFQALRHAPRVYLCTLTPIAPEDLQGAANRAIRERMNPAIRAVATETGAGLIDISAAFPNRPDLLPDGLHPNEEGAAIIARTVWAAIDPAPPPQIQPAPVAGPVDISIRNEARAALARADRWLASRPPSETLEDPCAAATARHPSQPDSLGDLLPLLDEQAPLPDTDPFFSFAVLACALDRRGQETVFLASGRPVPWRPTLLHRIVQRQRIDAQGNGFWCRSGSLESAADAPRSTYYARQALVTTLGE
jgi:lysophospholipase L1-like esterase